MKNFITNTGATLVLTFVIASNSFGSNDPLRFMVKGNFQMAKGFSKQERKPMMVYIHSTKCISSRTFTRQIVAKQDFAKFADKNFVCIEANVTTNEGKDIAKKYNVMRIPAIIMVSYDSDLEYIVEMKLDSVSLYNQFRSFLTANSLNSQIELLHSTNGLSAEDASKAIAQSYAKRDFKTNPNASAEMMAAELTLHINKLGNLNKEYIIAYNKLATEKSTGKTTKK